MFVEETLKSRWSTGKLQISPMKTNPTCALEGNIRYKNIWKHFLKSWNEYTLCGWLATLFKVRKFRLQLYCIHLERVTGRHTQWSKAGGRPKVGTTGLLCKSGLVSSVRKPMSDSPGSDWMYREYWGRNGKEQEPRMYVSFLKLPHNSNASLNLTSCPKQLPEPLLPGLRNDPVRQCYSAC